MTGNVGPINESERVWINGCVKLAHTLSLMYGLAEDGNVPLPPAMLDEIYARARLDPPPNTEPNDIINAIGLAFGQYIVDQCGFEWVVFTEHGQTDIAVYRKRGDVVVCPTNLIGKRYVDAHTHFLAPIFNDLLQSFARAEEPSKRSWWKFGQK